MTSFSRPLVATFAAGAMLGALAVSGVGAAMRGSAVFQDVPSGEYYDDAVGEMYGLGIIKGMDSSHFAPNDYVTRGQMAVLMKRLRDEINGVTPSTDTSSSSSRTSSSRSSSSKSSSSSSNSSAGTVKQTDSDAGTFAFTVATVNMPESAPKVSVSVVRTNGSKKAASVYFTTADISTTEGSDYVANHGTIDFGAGETEKTFVVTLKNDTLAEGNEQFKITLSAPTNGAGIGSPSTVTVTVLDDESPGPTLSSSSAGSSTSVVSGAGTLEFSASTYEADENAGNLTVTVTRTGGSNGAVGVTYATSDNTAKSGTDYTNAGGTLSFASGETTKTFTVAMLDNATVQGNRRFNLTLSANTGGAALGTQKTAVVVIVDDESITSGSGTLQFGAANFNASKGSSTPITITRISGTKGTATVAYATTDGTALAGTDYTTTNGTMTFQPGESTKTFFIPILSSAVTGRKINLTLSSSNGADLGANNALATVTVQ